MLILYLTTLIAFVCADAAAVASVSQQSPNQFVNKASLSDRQTNSAVTIEFKLPRNVSFDQATYRRLRELILRKRATKLPTNSTNATLVTETVALTTDAPTTYEPTNDPADLWETTSWEPKRRRRRSQTEPPSDDKQFELDDIQFVKLNQEVVDGVLRVAVFINKEGISEDLLWEIIQELNEENSLETELNFDINEKGKDNGIYRGLPGDDIVVIDTPAPATAAVGLGWRFYLGFLILAVLFIVLIFAIFCVVRHRKEQKSEKTLIRTPGESTSSIHETGDDNGFPDGLIMPFEDALLMQDEKNSYNSASPQITPL